MDHDFTQNTQVRRESASFFLSQSVAKKAKILVALLLAGWGLYAVLYGYHGTRLVQFPFDQDNSEAYLVYQGQRLAQGEMLYAPLEEEPYLVDNYPPVYPLLLAAEFIFTGPNFHWPRLLSFLSSLGIACCAGFITYYYTRERLSAVFSAIVFLSFYHVYDWGAYARVDSVGCLFAVLGLTVFIYTRDWRIPLGLCLLALFTRQTFFAAPLAIFFSLYPQSKKQAITFLLSLILLSLILFSLLLLLSQGRALNHLILYNQNEITAQNLLNFLRHWVFLYTIFGCVPLGILFAHRESRDYPYQHVTPLAWFSLFAFGEALFSGKVGAAPNYFFSLVTASAAGVGIVFSYILEYGKEATNRGKHLLAMVLIAGFVFQWFNTWHWPNTSQAFAYTPTREDTQSGRYVQRILQETAGPVLSDLAGTALMAGHPPIYEPFICTQLHLQGLWDEDTLLARIREREFTYVVLRFDLEEENIDRERFSQAMIDTLREHYSLQRQIGRYYLYQPKK